MDSENRNTFIRYCGLLLDSESLLHLAVIFEMEWKKGIEICTYRRHFCSEFRNSHDEVLKTATVGQSQDRADKIGVKHMQSTP